MSSQQQPHSGGSHHVRFYIVMVTLVIGAVLFILLMNDSSNGFGFTSAATGKVVSDKDNSSYSDDRGGLFKTEVGGGNKIKTVSDLMKSEAKKSNKAIRFGVNFNQIPSVREDTKVDVMELKFDDLTTNVKVNNDKLELNNLKEVGLKITGFQGKVSFDESTFSLNGKAQRIEVNDVALSSDQEIKVSFDNLNYQSFSIGNIQVKELNLPTGEGKISVADKLDYALDNDQLLVYYFDGKMDVVKGSTQKIVLDGTTSGLSISGSLLDFNLK